MTSMSAPATAAMTKFWIFAVTFAIAFALLYTSCVLQNWPLFTYHPAVGKLDFWMYRARPGENLGPPMYWYGWLALALPGAAIVGWIATIIPLGVLHRLTIFCCGLAALWWALYNLGVVFADRASFDAEFLKSVWVSAIPALVGAAAAAYFISAQWAARVWSNLLVIMPVGTVLILAYSLKPLFIR
jgi:hypothetical protein